MKVLTLPNPTEPRSLKPAHLITDRAKRYRAQNVVSGPKHCTYCGAPSHSTRKLDVEHIDGNEANANPDNIAYACRPCNASKGAAFARAGRGVKTRQYNPAKKKGKRTASSDYTFENYMMDMVIGRGFKEGDKAAAWSRIAALTPEDRSLFAKQLWRLRRARGTTRTGKQSEIPF